MFSKSCEYGLRAIIYITQQSIEQNMVSLKTIAAETGSPQPFTAKILQVLAKNNIVKSIKGPYGGFVVEADQFETKLSDIVYILDGDALYKGCGLGLSNCNEKSPCPLHFKFVEIRSNLKSMLEQTTIKSLATDISSQNLILKR